MLKPIFNLYRDLFKPMVGTVVWLKALLKHHPPPGAACCLSFQSSETSAEASARDESWHHQGLELNPTITDSSCEFGSL